MKAFTDNITIKRSPSAQSSSHTLLISMFKTRTNQIKISRYHETSLRSAALPLLVRVKMPEKRLEWRNKKQKKHFEKWSIVHPKGFFSTSSMIKKWAQRIFWSKWPKQGNLEHLEKGLSFLREAEKGWKSGARPLSWQQRRCFDTDMLPRSYPNRKYMVFNMPGNII